MKYYEETWLVGSYPLPLWNVFESGSIRTNNHVEGWPKKIVGKAHPNYSRLWKHLRKHSLLLKLHLPGGPGRLFQETTRLRN